MKSYKVGALTIVLIIKIGCRNFCTFCLLFTFLCLIPTAANAQITFAPPVRHDIQPVPPNSSIQGFASADFNGDSRLDVVVAVRESFTILMNRGDGTFFPPVIYPASTGQVIAIDLNRDGSPDLASLHGVMLNRGDGTFVPQVLYPTSLIPASIAAADFNQDGFIDLVIITVGSFGSSPEFHILRNDGSGVFTVLNRVALPDASRNVAAADVNRDGYPDLIAERGNTNSPRFISVLINQREGTFASPVSYPVGELTTVIAEDVNNDRSTDLIFPARNNWFGVMLNRGDGTFPDPVYYSVGQFFSPSTYAAHVDSDGYLDLVAFGSGESAQGYISILRNNRNGTFTTLPNIALGDQVISEKGAIAVDIDGDGRRDLLAVASNFNGSYLYVLKNTTPQPPGSPQLDTVSPNRGGNAGVVTVRILGTGFKSGAQIKLTGSGPDIIGTNTIVSSSGTFVTTTLDLRQTTPGARNVVVTNPDLASATIPLGFTVEQGGGPQIWVDVLGFNWTALGRQQTYYIHYGNRGNLDSGSARLWISFPSYFTWIPIGGQKESSHGRMGETTFIAFDVPAVPQGFIGSTPIRLKASNDPIYADSIFEIKVWKDGR